MNSSASRLAASPLPRSISDYQIHLNFLPVHGDFGESRVYRKLQVSPQEQRPDDSVMAYRLPHKAGDAGPWPMFWVSLEPRVGFAACGVAGAVNVALTTRLLFWSLIEATHKLLRPEQYHVPDNRFIEEISFVLHTHREGAEQLVVQPYYLRASKQFGLLMDFHFRLAEGIPFSRKVQQLSLSLDHSFRRNLDYCVDRAARVEAFRRQLQPVFGAMRLPGTDTVVRFASDFVALPADRLSPKSYVFAGAKESRSQFTGLRDYGPLCPLEGPPHLLFMFREQDRHAARTLAMSLKGSRQRQRFSFPGFQALFKSELTIDSDPVVLPNLSKQGIEVGLERVKTEKRNNPRVLPVVVLPEGDDNGYLIQKALFSHAEIPTQVCTLRILQDEDALKWAIANLALQVFCKAGGQPWKVRAAHERSLIVGISQSHKLKQIDNKTHVEKYFAFSVMTDSSGLFQKIQVLGEADNQGDYLTRLQQNLKSLLAESASQFARIVVHTSFKLRHSEIDAIQDTVRTAASGPTASTCKFAVVKVNHRSRFFGVNRSVNSNVPYEGSRVWLGPREYLVWFEGIFPDKPTVTKAFPGPTHLQILRVSDENAIPEHVLLQDLVNLSGANWRGFNAKSAPVSVFYCHLVADLVHDFHEQGLPLPAVADIRPWFL